jgi:nucleoside-diphosphate-sugar epimerase
MRVFVTGASGWIGSALVPELLAAGHEVVGLARSDASTAALANLGVTAQRGSLDDLAALRSAAAASDGVIHLAFKHDLAFSGDFVLAAEADRQAIEVLGDALLGSDRPFLIASGVLGLGATRLATEEDGRAVSEEPPPFGGPRSRSDNATYTLALKDRGVRSSVVRLSPTCHGKGDNGFIHDLVGVARDKGVSGYVGDGSQRWPAVHRLDAARLFARGLEAAPAGSVLHGVAEEGVRTRDIAEAIGANLELPVVSIAPEEAYEHFGFLGFVLPMDTTASSVATQALVGWTPREVGLLEDLDEGHYFDVTAN